MQSLKTYEIDMSCLSAAQKTLCVKLLARSQLDFHQQQNKFVAHLQIEPSKLSSKTEVVQGVKGSKKGRESCYELGKKPIGRVVKMDKLRRLQQLHGVVEVYVYPKRMQLWTLVEEVEETYERYWQVTRGKNQLCFAEWVYNYIVGKHVQHVKMEQHLVSFLDSLNYFAVKHSGLRLYLSFLSQHANVLAYYLVLRNLLQQVTRQRTVEKSNNRYRMKNSALQRRIYEDSIEVFLQLVFGGERTRIFQSITCKMYFDEEKNKNFIFYYDLLDYLVSDFISKHGQQLTTDNNTLQEDSLLFSSNDTGLNDSPMGSRQDQSIGEEQLCIHYSAQGKQNNPKVSFKTKVKDQTWLALNRMCEQLKIPLSADMRGSIQRVLSVVVENQKSVWFREENRNEEELLYMEKLQLMFKDREEKQILLHDLVKRILMAPGVRESIVQKIML